MITQIYKYYSYIMVKCVLCSTRASFNIKGEKEKYCAKHKTNDMINVVCRLCEYTNCNIRAIYAVSYTHLTLPTILRV